MLQSNLPSTPSIWRQLYECAIQEQDDTKVHQRVTDARNAILDRTEEILTQPPNNERLALNHALRTLQLPEEVAVREKSAAAQTPETIADVEAGLDTLSNRRAVVHSCERCGSEMVNLNATIFLADNEKSWNVSLPICPKCERLEYLGFISSQAA
jgi:hypothetical protein